MPPTCRALGAEPTDPTQHQPHARKRRWQEGATHSSTRLVSAESELGTLPFSALLLSQLHTRSGLGRSAVLRRTHSNHVPLRYPRTVPIEMVAQWVLLSHIACPRSPLRAPQRPCCRTAPARCPRHAARSEQSRPIRPNISRTRKRHWQEGATHRNERLVSAEIELGTLPVSLLLLRPLHTRSGLGRSGGATPHPQQPCAPTVPAHRTHGRGWPNGYSSVTSRARVRSESTTTALAAPHPSMPPPCRALGAEPTDPTLLGRTRKRHWQEGATHRNERLVSVESELGTLPVSLLLLR